MDDATVRAWHRRQLKWALQALAIPAEAQLRLFPDWVVKADELALDFDHWALVIRSNYAEELTHQQSARLADVDRSLGEMPRGGAGAGVDLWSDDALRSSPHWVQVRQCAGAALAAFGWPVEGPPADPRDRGATYVRG